MTVSNDTTTINTTVYRVDSNGREALSTERATCAACGAEGWRGDWPEQGGIVPDPARGGRLYCDDCAAVDALTAIDSVHGWSVVDAEGGRWWPDEDTAELIAGSADPAATALRICRDMPTRGHWSS